jgi:hypothetical protein
MGCAHGTPSALPEADSLRATTCAPGFDSCPDGTQVCNVGASGWLMVCEPVDECAVTCPFSCGAIGSGSCGP